MLDSPEQFDQIRRAQLQMIWEHARGGTIAATAFALLLAFYARELAPLALVVGWAAAKVLAAGARVWQGVLYDRAGRPGRLTWRRATYQLLFVDGVVWGLGGYYMAGTNGAAASLIAGSLVGVTSIATFGLQARSVATAAYAAPILVLTSLGLLARLDDLGLLLGIGLLFVLALQVRTASQSEKRVVEVHRLRVKADALAAERSEALELAQRESAAKSQFLANISHELRTPLHGILGLSRLMHVEVPTDALKQRVELIESSGAHLLRLINDLIDVGRLHTDKVPLRPQRFDLAYELETLMGVYAVRADDKSQSFTSHLEIPKPFWVTGDSARLRQVLHNILSNACKYTPVRGAITVSARHVDGMLHVECRDTGLGIKSNELEHIFEAFTQVGEVTSASDGAGIGLTIAREVARAMGGDVTVQSAVGVGSAFTLTIALPAVGPKEVAPTLQLVMPSARSNGHGAVRRVLVVDDDDVGATIATAALERVGLNVERVRNGAEAVKHALRETFRPDIVLMDCRMPVMDGFDATREIRTQETALRLPRVPIIAVTASDSGALKDVCLAAGMDDLLPKPFATSDLYSMLMRWLDTLIEAESPSQAQSRVAGW